MILKKHTNNKGFNLFTKCSLTPRCYGVPHEELTNIIKKYGDFKEMIQAK